MKPTRQWWVILTRKKVGDFHLQIDTTTLFAALEVLQGKVVGQCYARHRHQEFLKFLKRLDQEFPPEFVSGRSKLAEKGQMKTGHFESGIAQGAAQAALLRDEPTQREPATFHRHAGGQRLVGAQDCPRTGHPSGNRRPVFAPA